MPSRCLFLVFVLIFVQLHKNGQSNIELSHNDSAGKFDFSALWCSDSLLNLEIVDDTMYFKPRKFVFPEPLGFIGDSFQRFYIHFSSVKKDENLPLRYSVTGKTRVNRDICSFSGTITIDSVYFFTDQLRCGRLLCSIRFAEEKGNTHTGIITGRMTTSFCFYDGRVCYDNVDAVSDGYSNNQVVARWNSYDGKLSFRCNWGDYRIPESEQLDIGTGDFSPFDKYRKFGWQNYADQISTSKDSKTATQEAEMEWWK
jgi:hypothetical protein